MSKHIVYALGGSDMSAGYDVFVSHAWADGDRPRQIAEALQEAGLRVWFDAVEINDFTSITRAVTEGLAQSKALLAYYSKTYALRRACQWELTAAFLAAQAEGDPRRRVLVISPEQKAEHIHPIELRDAKFHTAPTDEGIALRDLAQSVVNHVAMLDGPLADIHPLSAPNWYGMAPVGSTRFVGRLKEMWEVHSLLHAGDVAQVSYATAATGSIGRISGLGGVGKSLLAEEYALHFGSAYPGGVFWLRAYGNDDAQTPLGPEQREALRTDQVRQMAERLSRDTCGMTGEQVEGALVRKISSQGKPCLWVVDDVPNGLDAEALRRWFAPNAVTRTLITTRSGEYGSLAKGIDLSVLARDEAYQRLTSRRMPADGDEEEQAQLLAADLGDHALALDVTASALVSFAAAKPFGDFRAKLARPDKDALVLAEALADALPNGHEKSIAQTMLRSLRGLGEDGQDFVRLASVLAVAPIPASLVTVVFQEADKLSREDAEEHASLAFKQVTSASLAEIAGQKREARAVHTLVSRTIRFQERGSPERTEALRAAAIVALRAAIATAAENPRLHRQVELQVTHGRQVVSQPATTDEAALVGCVARYDLERGAYVSARTLYERELDFCRREWGPEHPDTLISMGNLAETLRAQGDWAGARQLQEQTLNIRRQVLGPEHPHTLSSMNNLAVTLREQGDWAAARLLQEQTLNIRRRVLGLEHPDTLISMGNLALTLSAQGDWAGARQLEEETLNIRRRLLGPEHPDTLSSMNHLAGTLSAQGDWAAARLLQEETLNIRRQVLGPEHPDMLSSMNNLALTLSAQSDLAGARLLQVLTLDILRRVLGPEHPNTLSSMSNLARTLRAQGDWVGARQLQEQTLNIRRRVLGPEHPDTLSSMTNLAETLRAQGDWAGARQLQELKLDTQQMKEAEAAYQEALSVRRELAKANPEAYLPEVATTLNNLAILYRDTQRMQEADAAYQEALSIRRELAKSNPGAYLPEVATTLNNVAILYSDTQRMKEAEAAFQEALSIRRELAKANPGAHLPDVPATLNNLAILYGGTQRMKEAEAAYQEALSIRRELAKANPEVYLPNVAATMNDLANLYRATDQMEEAEGRYQEALSTYRELAKANPVAYLPDVAMMLNNLAILYRDKQRMKEAHECCRQAEWVLEPLWRSNAKVHGDHMARILYVRALLDDSRREACALLRRAFSSAYDPDIKLLVQHLLHQLGVDDRA